MRMFVLCLTICLLQVVKGAPPSASQEKMSKQREAFFIRNRLDKLFNEKPDEFYNLYFKKNITVCFNQGKIMPCFERQGAVVSVSNRSVTVMWRHTEHSYRTDYSASFMVEHVERREVTSPVSIMNVDTNNISLGSCWGGYVIIVDGLNYAVQPITTPDDLKKIKAKGCDVVGYALAIEQKTATEKATNAMSERDQLQIAERKYMQEVNERKNSQRSKKSTAQLKMENDMNRLRDKAKKPDLSK